MAARTAKSKEMIRISCEGAPGPGLAWTITIEFRPTNRGYSVWVYEDNVMTDRPKWIRVASCAWPLTWRAAYDSLVANENLRVFGDFWFETWIDGLPVWAASVLRLVFIVDNEGPYDYKCLADLLIGFTDEEIQSVVSASGLNPFEKPLSEDEENQSHFQKLASIAGSAITAGLIGRSLQEIRSELDASSDATLDDLDLILWRRATDIKHSLEQQRIAEFIESAKEPHPIVLPDNDNHQEAVRSHLCEWESISRGPLPKAIDIRIDLISRWLSETERPQSGHVVQSRFGTSEWRILMWLLSSNERGLLLILAELLNRRPEEAKFLANQVMRSGTSEAYYFEGPNRLIGWAQNVIGRHVHAAHVDFALKFQSVCDTLKIPTDDKYRIGELPYLPPRKP